MLQQYYLRSSKAKQLQNWYNEYLVEKEHLEAHEYESAIILPLRNDGNACLAWGLGGVVDADGQFINESAIPGYYNYGYNDITPVTREETVVYLGYFRKHWGDFLVDCTNRLWYSLSDHTSVDRYVFFCDAGKTLKLDGAYREFFELLGIWNKLDIINTPTRYKRVIIPESSFCRQKGIWCPKNYLKVFDAVRDNALNKTAGQGTDVLSDKRIFLTRSMLLKAKRNELGLDLLDSFFSCNGYKVIAPEELSLREQIEAINNADIVACCSGTLPHNMLFGKQEQKLVIIERNALNNRVQPYISRMRALEVYHVDGNYTIYPVELAYGPFIYGYSKELKQFVEHMGYVPPDESFLSQRYLRRVFRAYMELYRKEHYASWYMGGDLPWMTRDIDILYEAYLDSESVFGAFLKGKKMFSVRQLFEIRFLKRFIKTLVVKARSYSNCLRGHRD